MLGHGSIEVSVHKVVQCNTQLSSSEFLHLECIEASAWLKAMEHEHGRSEEEERGEEQGRGGVQTFAK